MRCFGGDFFEVDSTWVSCIDSFASFNLKNDYSGAYFSDACNAFS